MLDFVFILAIIFEIIATIFIVVKIIEFEKKIQLLNENLTLIHGVLLELIGKIRLIITKINRVVKIFENKRFITISIILRYAVTTLQIYLLIRSIRQSGSLIRRFKSINFKLIRKVLFANAVYKLINYILRLCANRA